MCPMIENYIGWPAGVSKVILSDTSISMGENATNTDNLESGGKRTELKGGYISDKYAVVMEFEWEEPMNDLTHKTEYQKFCEWYKYKHKFGSVPFAFPKILYSPQTGITVLDNNTNEPEAVEYYKITSGISNAQRSGSKMRISMTWESVYGGVVDCGTESASLEGSVLELTKNSASITFESLGNDNTEPVPGNFSLVEVDGNTETEIDITGFCYDNSYTVKMWFDDLSSGEHTIKCTINYASLVDAELENTINVPVGGN